MLCQCINSVEVVLWIMSAKEEAGREAEESLLYSARHGELSVVKALLEAKLEGKLTLDINCKGKNLEWFHDKEGELIKL